MWPKSLKSQLIESLHRENAALRALLSKCGVTLPDSGVPSVQRRTTSKVTEANVYHASRDTRFQDQVRRQQETNPDPQAQDSSAPNENSNA